MAKIQPVTPDKIEKTQDLKIANYKSTRTKLPDGTVKEEITIGELSNKTNEKTESVNKKYLVGYSFGINRDLDILHKINAAKLYDLPIIRDVYIGVYLSLKDSKPNEAGLTLTKLF